MSIVIVALPSVDEKVNKISSEKKAHLTLMYLGDSVPDMDIPDIVTFVQHAARHLDPFYLSVDYRGTLGDEEADVLFFEENFWELPRLKRFRHNLLLNDAIRRAHDGAEQFSEFLPHLTLGYPSAPARKDPEDDPPRFYGIQFDRLAVWFGDYEGPEIRLKYDYHGDMEVAMHSTDTSELGAELAGGFLAHYGVKGMRWGYTTKSDGTQVATLQREKKSRLTPGAKDVTVTQRRAGTLVRAKGGQRQKASEDAVKAEAVRQKSRKSTTDSLSNRELKAAIERMNLEQQYAKLAKKNQRISLGQKIIEAALGKRPPLLDKK